MLTESEPMSKVNDSEARDNHIEMLLEKINQRYISKYRGKIILGYKLDREIFCSQCEGKVYSAVSDYGVIAESKVGKFFFIRECKKCYLPVMTLSNL